MNIFKWWKQRLHKRKIQRAESGYKWAMDGLQSGKLTIEGAEGCVELSRTFVGHDEFDEGVEQACNEWSSRDE